MTMLRLFLALLLAGNLLARASEAIDAPTEGATAWIKQPHVTARLIPEVTSVMPGQTFAVALQLHSDAGWHTYWINPGDAGLATEITWTLPDGFKAGPIQWPTPERHNMGPLITFGYEGDVYLLTTITAPMSLPQGSGAIKLKALAKWLVCQEECIPGKAELALNLDSGLTVDLPRENKELFAKARMRLPVENTRWDVKATYTKARTFILNLKEKSGHGEALGSITFFPEQPNVLSSKDAGPWIDSNDPGSAFFEIPLEQNGEKPAQLSGMLASNVPLISSAKSVSLAAFDTNAVGIEQLSEQPNNNRSYISASQTAGNAQPVAAAVPSGGSVFPSATAPPMGTSAATTEVGSTVTPEPFLLAVLGAAFIGGLILNLMPCVLPVLSLKVFALVRHAGEDPRGAWKQGVAFTVGVVLSFWALAGLLLVLKATGSLLGWGFQMQSPGFVLFLIFLFFLLGLNLFGVFEIGTSLVGLDAKATGRFHGLTSSFLNGALATLAATPCTAPFMGGALGFAAKQPPFIAMLVFTFLALGMATPYLLLAIFPGALRFVPKPGEWMVAFKQFMGFLLMATVIFLVYVFGSLTSEEQMIRLLFILLLTSIGTWVYGRWGVFRTVFYAVGVIAVYCASSLFSGEADSPVGTITFPLSFQPSTISSVDKVWQPWSPSAVDAALAKGQPVFVDFTADWCLSCKVNEQVALGTDAVKQAFAQKNVALFKADWTRADPEISKTLQQYNRDGVPLYLLYSPAKKDAPQVLPEVLTPGIVLDALKGL